MSVVSSSCLLFILYFTCYVASSTEQDIYNVITGEPDAPRKKSLDPVYYVGVYDEKPKLIPSKYEIELMTADSGKRFTCIIPKDNTFVPRSPVLENDEETDTETEIESETYVHDKEDAIESEPPKTAEERLQEVDTLDNRDRYIQELMVQSRHKKQKHLKNGRWPCYYSREGYWNYEVCLYDKITQYHGSKKKRNPNIKLGGFASYIDVSKILMKDPLYPYLYLTDIYGVSLFENTEKNFVHLLYNDGEAKRESLVTIQCSKAYGKRSKDSIIKIKEPKIHHYHFTVIYKAVCDYTQWLRREYGIYETAAGDGAYEGSNDGDIHMNVNDGSSSSSALSTTTTSAALLNKRDINPNSDDVSLLLSPLLDLAKQKRCLLLKQGWWTVEFCYGQYIRQIHLEAKQQKNKKGQIVQSLTEWDIKQEHVIGKWDTTQAITKEAFVIHRNENDARRTYASMVYDNGDQCDLNKKPRKTEIQFRCGLTREHSELIKSREDPSCYYIAQVETPLLCGHPEFKIPTAPKHEIVCYPLDEKEFVNEASSMKQVAEIEGESDAILRMVTGAVQKKYETEKNNMDQPTDSKTEL